MNTQRFVYSLTFLLVLFAWPSWAQVKLSGVITDGVKPLAGANIIINETTKGTTSDPNGAFNLQTLDSLPVTLVILAVGHLTQKIKVTPENALSIRIALLPQDRTNSKVPESVFLSPATVDRIGAEELMHTPALDGYGAVAYLKGVQTNTSSLTLTSYNLGGFADMQNGRMVHLVDGLDISPPGLNFSLGGNHIPSDLDIAGIELVQGPSPASYGANALNGTIDITAKDPFTHKGLSAYSKGGMTVQEAGGNHPLFDFGLRYADASSDGKLGFKVNFNYFTATDWQANDETHILTAPPRSGNVENILNRSKDHPAYNAIHVYGDELYAQVTIDTLGTKRWYTRTGIKEADIVDYGIENFKVTGGLYYQLADSIRIVYNFHYFNSDAILRSHSVFPLVDFKLFNHSLKLEGPHWEIKTAVSQQDANNSYALFNTGRWIENNRKLNAAWSEDYGTAYRGEVPGIAANDHAGARQYADRDLVGINSEAFATLKATSLNKPLGRWDGSLWVDNSRSFQSLGHYYFKQIEEILELQVGGNYQRIMLDSDGRFFNDGLQGFGAPIVVNEFGLYLQAGKKLVEDRLYLRGSLRYDQYQKLDGKVTPGVSAVYALDHNQRHIIRASVQSGIRNPSPQEAYMNLNIGSTVYLGGTSDNIEHYQFSPNKEVTLNGPEIFQGLATEGSYYEYQAGGRSDPTLFVPAKLSFLNPEKNTTYQVGYRGLLMEQLYVDINYYQSTYEDFIVRSTSYSPAANVFYQIYTNLDQDVTTSGLGAGITGWFGNEYQAGVGYTYIHYEEVDVAPTYWLGFNTPKNRVHASISNDNLYQSGFGFNLKFRYWDDYQWRSGIGQGEIEANSVIDLALSYQLKSMQSQLKIGANNLFLKEYQTVYAGPQVGSVFYVSWTYDQAFGR